MNDNAAKEIEQVKRLLILLLVKIGGSSAEIGAALGIDQSAIRRLVPARKVRKIAVPYVKE